MSLWTNLCEKEKERKKENGRSDLCEKIWPVGVELDANVNSPSHRSSPRELVRAPNGAEGERNGTRSYPKTLTPSWLALRTSGAKCLATPSNCQVVNSSGILPHANSLRHNQLLPPRWVTQSDPLLNQWGLPRGKGAAANADTGPFVHHCHPAERDRHQLTCTSMERNVT